MVVVATEGVEGDVEDDGGVEPEGFERNVEGEVRHRRINKRHANNPIEGLQPNSIDDLHDLGADDDESEGTFVHERWLSDAEWESEELDSMNEFEDGEEDISTSGKFSSFEMPKNMTDFSWDLGTYFTDKEAFKDAIRTYVVHSGRNLKLIKNDNSRVRVCCIGEQGQCEWCAYCGFLPSTRCWQLRKLNDMHISAR